MSYKHPHSAPQLNSAAACQTNVPPELREKIVTLVERVNVAKKAFDVAVDAAVEAKAEYDSRAKELGQLLIEAKALHVSNETFNVFLDKYVGLKKSRAYELMRIANGKTTVAAVKQGQRKRKAESRAKKKQSKSAESSPDSVTKGSVTEKGEIGTASINPQDSADQRRVVNAAAETVTTESTIAEAPVSRRKTSVSERTGHVGILSAWIAASPTERAKALDSIGLNSVLEAIPPSWLPLLEQRFAGRRQSPTPPVVSDMPEKKTSIPADGSIPDFMKREASCGSDQPRQEPAPCTAPAESFCRSVS